MGLGHRQLVRLKMTPEEVNNFTPPKGIDISWYDYDQGEVTADITGMEWCPNDVEFVYKEEVNHLLAKLKVSQDGIRSSKYPIPFIRKIDTYVDFIEDTEYDYLISKGKIDTEIINKQRLQSLPKSVDVEPVNRNTYKLQTVGFTV